MLTRLYIQNFALIDSLDIEFGKGLNILTGETGAGKSIILGALSLILGQRAESRMSLDENKKCIIEGYFDVSTFDLSAFFDAYDLDFDARTILRREFSADGKSRAFINDTPVNLAVLKALGEQLIDIHSQHATLQVASPDFQLNVLDSVAGNLELRKKYVHRLAVYKKSVTDLEQLIEKVNQAHAERDYKQFLHDELDMARLEAGEVKTLEVELDQLEHAEEIKSGLYGAVALLQDNELNAGQLLKEASNLLSKSLRFMPSLQEQHDRLQSSLIEIKDLAGELELTSDTIHINEARHQEVKERLDLLYTLQHKHRLEDADDLIPLRDELAGQLQASFEDQLLVDSLKQEMEEHKGKLQHLAEELRKGRLKAIPLVQKSVIAMLKEIGMPDSQLLIELSPSGQSEFRKDGLDLINYLFTSNKGQLPQPVGKVASGGELSRLMLSIKALVAVHSTLPTIIFDEIDTGISGEVALRVGAVLEQLGQHLQVISISHLPQIASKGRTHYKVFKTIENDRAVTRMALLTQEERVLEIAQMLSGADPGEAAISHARALLEQNQV